MAHVIGGPESAGANPGPASYCRAVPDVTDCNVMVGKLQPFPKVLDGMEICHGCRGGPEKFAQLVEEIGIIGRRNR